MLGRRMERCLRARTRLLIRAGIQLALCGLYPLAAYAQQSGKQAGSVLVGKKNQVETAPGASAAAWKQADIGAELAVHDRLRTGDLSQASVRLTDLSVLQ